MASSSFKNVTVISRLLLNKCKVAGKRTTGGKCIKGARGSGKIETTSGITFYKQNYAIKLFNLNLFLWRHLLLSSDLLLSVVARLDCRIASFLARQGLHDFAPG